MSELAHSPNVYRFLERYWGKGIATEAVVALVRYLTQETDIEIITASIMVANKTITHVVEKNNFYQRQFLKNCFVYIIKGFRIFLSPRS